MRNKMGSIKVFFQLWTNGNRVSKLVILEENGSHKTSNVKTTIKYDAANQIPALLAIARKILYQTY